MSLWLYVYGNGEFIYTILNSVNFFMHNAITFFKVATVIGLLIFAIEATGVSPTRNYDWMRFVRMYFIIAVFIMTPYPFKINVHDVLKNQDYTFNPSSGRLPIGLIVPIALTSDIMYRLINLYQQNYAIDSNLNYTYSGMNFGANFILSLDSVNSYDDKFNYNLDNYMQNCGFPLLHKAGKLSELRKSLDIFETLKQNTSGARYVQQVDFVSGNPLVKPCDVAIKDIDDYYYVNKDNILMNNANRMGVDTSTSDLKSRFLNAADATSRQLIGVAQGSATALKQAIAMNMIMASVKNGAQSVGNGSLALSVYDTEQFQQYKKVGELSGSASARTIPILVGVGFALLFFLYPIMIFLAIARGSYKAIGVFFQIVIAINLIPLLYEILNYISTYYLQNKLGITITGSGFNYDVSTSLYSFTDNMIVAGNYLATSAPLIAYAIVSGSAMALTSVFGHINDPAKSQAQQVGNEMARGNQALGNVSIDNASFNNMQGNKLDDQFITSSGVPILKDTSSGGVHTNAGGQNYDQNFKEDLFVKPNFAHMASSQVQNILANSQQTMGQLSKQWGQQSQRLHELGNSMQSQQGKGFASGSEEANALAHAQAIATRISGSFGGQVFGTGATIGMDSQINDKLNHDLKDYQKYSNELSHSSNQAIKDAFSNTSNLSTSSSKTMQEAVNTSQTLNDINSNQSSINADFSNDFGNYMRNRGLDPRQMSATQQTVMAEQFVNEKLNNQYGIKTDLATPSLNKNGINNLANNASSNNVNDNGLSDPQDNISSMGNSIHNNTNQGIDKFKNHAGYIIDKQIGEHAGVVVDVGKDVAKDILKSVEISGNAINNVVKDVATDSIKFPYKTFNEETMESIKSIKEIQNVKNKQ
ncbi:MAG: conjugal transfer protein TraG N-terminal domain-containing protein [Burkholderiales bacterium]|nr:conjugal transfer protein TraG N-terminal domain-containing protein [Burkholderiales bacterium]